MECLSTGNACVRESIFFACSCTMNRMDLFLYGLGLNLAISGSVHSNLFMHENGASGRMA